MNGMDIIYEDCEPQCGCRNIHDCRKVALWAVRSPDCTHGAALCGTCLEETGENINRNQFQTCRECHTAIRYFIVEPIGARQP